MLKELLLISALTFTPMVDSETPTEPTTGEVVEDTTGETTTEEESFDLEKWLSEFLDATTVSTIMSWVAYIATIIGLVAKLKSLAKSKTMTVENVKVAVDEELAKNKVELSEEVKNTIETYLPSILKTAKNQNEIMKAIIKIIALSTKDDEASRLAILEVISSLGVIEQDITDEASESVKETATTNENKKQEAISKVDDMIIKGTTSEDGTSI